MANNKATFIIDVVSKGLKGARDSVAGIGKSARQAGEAHIAANAAAKDFHNTQAKGVIGTANSTKSFSKLAETMGSGGGLVGAYATLAANIFAVSAAFNALRSAAQVQQVLEGLNASGARTGLTLSVAANRVKELSGNMLSMEQAMRSTSQVMAAGFNTKDLERLTVVAKDASFALGRNMQDSMDRLTRGIVKLEPELLDELGIMTKLTESNRNVASSLGKSESALTSFEKRQGFANAVLAEGELKFGGLSKAAGNTTAYDKLAATFSDLVKDIFNGINVIGKPIAEFLASSKAALIGLGILFVSTIRKQFLPIFNELGQKAQEASQNLAKKSVADMKGISKMTTDVNSDFRQWTASVIDGTAKQQDYRDALKSVNAEIKEHQRTIDTGRNSRGQFVKNDDIPIVQRELTTYKKAREEMLKYDRAQKRSAGLATGASAIDLGASNSPIAGLSILRKSFAELDASVATSTKGLDHFKNGMTKAGLGMRFFGASLLAALPYIGLIIAGATLLYNYFKTKLSPEQEEYNKRLADFRGILDTVNDKVTAYNRIQNSAGSASTRAVEALTLQTNAVMELAGAYETVEAAAKKSAEASVNAAKAAEQARKDNIEKAKGYADRVTMDQDTGPSSIDIASKLKITAGSKTMENFVRLAKEGGKEGEILLQALDGFEKLDPKGFNKFVDQMGGPAIINAQNLSQTINTAGGVIDNISNKASNAKGSLDALQSSFTNAEKAAADFMLSSVASTPFDALSESIGSSHRSLERFVIDLKQGNIEGDKFIGVVSGIGGKFSQILDPAVSSSLDKLKKIQAEVDTMKLANPNMNKEQQGLYNQLLEKRNQLGFAYASILRKDLILSSQRIAKLQEQTRTLDQHLKLEQARLSTVKGIYELNGAGLISQYEQEEKIRNVKVQQIKLEIVMQENILKSKEAAIALVELAQKKLYVDKLDLAVQERMATINAESDPKKKLAMLMDSSVYETAKKNAELDNAKLQLDIDGLRAEAAVSLANIKNFKNETATILAENLNSAQKLARARDKDYEVSQKGLELLKEQADLLGRISITQEKLRDIRDGNIGTINSELTAMIKANKLARERLRIEHLNVVEGLLNKKAITEADVARAKAEGLDTKAGIIGVENAQNEIIAKRTILELTIKELDDSEKLAIIEKVRFDTRKEGLEWQREALSYMEKEISLAGDLQKTQLKNAQIREQISMKRNSIPESDSFKSAQNLQVQIQAYDLAVAELNLRENMIDLEYALMDAQQLALREELSARKAWLLASVKGLNENSLPIKQITTAINALQAASARIPEMRDMAKQGGRAGIDNMRLELERDSIPQSDVFISQINTLSGEFAGLVREQAAQQTAQRVVQEKLAQQVTAVVAQFDNNALPVEVAAVKDELKAAVPPILSMENNIAQIAGDVRTLVERAGEGAGGVTAGSVNATGSAKTAMDFFMGKGWNATQAAGIVGNLIQESGLNPDSHNKKENAQGIAQWRDGRLDDFLRVIGKTVSNASYEEQLKFVDWELKNSEARAGNLLKAATTVERAAYVVDKFFERSAGIHLDERVANARKLVAGGTPTTGSASIRAPSNDNARTVTEAPRTPTTDQSKIIKIELAAEAKKIGVTTADGIIDIPMGIDMTNLNILVEAANNKLAEIKPIRIDVNTENFGTVLKTLQVGMAPFLEDLRKLGPEGEMVASFSQGMVTIMSATKYAFDTIKASAKDGDVTFKESMANIGAGLAVASSVVSTISQIVAASADAKVQAIDREIAAEQKRDGKSEASIAKLKALEAKKDAINKKAFNTNKKLMIAQAIISTASGMAQALGQLGPIAGPIMAAVIGAMGAAQIAIIAGTQYQSTASNIPSTAMPDTLKIGKRGENVDLARHNSNVGGELGYLRGSDGYGQNSSNYRLAPGSAYGGRLNRGYGHRGFMVGEKGPEMIMPEVPMTVRPNNDNSNNRPIEANFNIQAFDGDSVQNMLYNRRGDIIDMLRETANASGTRFLEDVNTNFVKKANSSGARRI